MASETNKPERLADVRHKLLELHQSLVNAERLRHEKVHGRVTAGGFLDLLVNDPTFAWLRPMTALIVQLDEVLDEEASPDSWQAAVAQLRALLVADPEGAPFHQHYAQLLQESPEVGLAHGAALRALHP